MRRFPVAAAVVLSIALAGHASADVTHYTDGCYYCRSTGPTGLSQECTRAGFLSNGQGDGLNCWQDSSLGWPAGSSCWTDTNPCYEVVVNGGPNGGQTSGGGGSTCRYVNGYCAPWCGSCSQVGPQASP